MAYTAVFRVAAGPRMGFGHLVRSRTLSEALGLPAAVSLRGGPGTRTAARRLGCTVVDGPLTSLLEAIRPDVLIVDDPSQRDAERAVRVARRFGIPTASVHDLGVAPCGSDLSIDGTIAPGHMDLAGPRYAVIDPRLARVAASRQEARRGRPIVFVAFGGGSRRRLAAAVAQAIVRRCPNVQVRVAGGFCGPQRLGDSEAIVAVGPRLGLAKELAAATVAVLAGGVTLYEACAIGLPAVGVSIVRAQRPSVAGLARHGAVVDGGHAGSVTRTARHVARLVDELLATPNRRRVLSHTARRLVDGGGAARVASAVRSVIAGQLGRRAA